VFVAAARRLPAVNIQQNVFDVRQEEIRCVVSSFLYSVVHADFADDATRLGDHEIHIYSVRTEAMKTFWESARRVWKKAENTLVK
jgi:hypothetical protein